MKILVASPIDQQAIDHLTQHHDVICAFNASEERLGSLIEDREALIFRSGVTISSAVLDRAPGIRLLLRAGSGLDNLDLEYTARRGIQLVRVPGPGAQAVAEMTFALMLALARNVVVADRGLRQGRWLKSELTGHLLTGKTLGVIGLGKIGTRVAEMGVAWGMRAVGCVDSPSPERRAAFAAAGIRLASCDEVLAEADFLSVHVPLTEANRNLIDAEALARMKPGSFLVNIARGGVVDEDALLRELVSGARLIGAALDVHQREGEGKISPLAGLPNVVLTPHIGASTLDSQRAIGREVIAIVDSFAGSVSGIVPSNAA